MKIQILGNEKIQNLKKELLQTLNAILIESMNEENHFWKAVQTYILKTQQMVLNNEIFTNALYRKLGFLEHSMHKKNSDVWSLIWKARGIISDISSWIEWIEKKKGAYENN